jgi:carboxylesterase type B
LTYAGFFAGGVADPRYNTSYLVNASIAMGKPMIAVSFNYRLAGWGFLASKEVVNANASNIALFDQRLALQWIQENIGAFGGDPRKVTIVGESAGAFSVGYHLLANEGDNEGLFRAAVMESGSAFWAPRKCALISQTDTSLRPRSEETGRTRFVLAANAANVRQRNDRSRLRQRDRLA